jgi:membrane associated rhomboid family serine protease
MSLTIVILVLTIGISYMGFQNSSLLYKWDMNPVQIRKYKEYYRFVLSGFIHADWGHLFFNMFSLYFVGEGMENIFKSIAGPQNGMLYFGLLYITGIVVSDLPSFFKHKNDSNYHSLGASGGVSAIVFSFVTLVPLGEIQIYFIPMPAIIFGVLYLVYCIYASKRGTDNVNHSAHLYGALWGMVYTAIVFPFAVPNFINEILSVF